MRKIAILAGACVLLLTLPAMAQAVACPKEMAAQTLIPPSEHRGEATVNVIQHAGETALVTLVGGEPPFFKWETTLTVEDSPQQGTLILWKATGPESYAVAKMWQPDVQSGGHNSFLEHVTGLPAGKYLATFTQPIETDFRWSQQSEVFPPSSRPNHYLCNGSTSGSGSVR